MIKSKLTIEINDIEKLSFNVYNNLHWTKQKEFKDKLGWQVKSAFNKKLESGYSLYFEFEFVGKKLDTINVVHYVKRIEDIIFPQDNENKTICINVNQGNRNKVKLMVI
ncbi:MAG: hypothetical protein DRJ01_09695 [Bacteroidetes bacterium]|nr:MAG: hypothetical protein DRJ01_09695 [Bacteroidota bacterium]